MALGQGYTVEGQLSRSEVIGGFQIRVYEPSPGRFPDEPPDVRDSGPEMLFSGISRPPIEMGIAAGGKVTQKIYPDTYGIDTWDPDNYATLFVHLVNSEQYMEITGLEPPPTPISAQTYASYGLPWFGLYDEHMGDLSPSAELGRVKTIREIDAERRTGDPAEAPLLIDPRAVHNLHHGPPPARKDEPGGGRSEVQ
jgi:hypothetical protein